MTILEYKEVLINRKAELEKEMIMADARLQVVDEIISMGIDFRKDEETEATEEDTEVEEIAETAPNSMIY